MTDLGEEEDTAVDEPGNREEDGEEEGEAAEASEEVEGKGVLGLLGQPQEGEEVAAKQQEEGEEGEDVEAVDEEPGGHGGVAVFLQEAKYNADKEENQGDHLSWRGSQRLE